VWCVTIQCSDDDWRIHGKAFKLLAEQYPVTLISSKKMPADDRRIMSYQIEDVNDAEEFTDESMKLDGFKAIFESL
jgi:hypothetical protein